MEKTTVMSNTDERRAGVRTEDHSVLDLKILFASETPGLLGKNIAGSSIIDVSASGLGLTLDCEVPVKSTLDIRVTLKGDFEKFALSAKVQWCKPSDDEGLFLVGIALRERTDEETDLENWKKEFSS